MSRYLALREKCPDTEFFLVRIFPHSDWIRIRKTPYLDTFHAVLFVSRVASVSWRTRLCFKSKLPLVIFKYTWSSWLVDKFFEAFSLMINELRCNFFLIITRGFQLSRTFFAFSIIRISALTILSVIVVFVVS